MKVLHAIAGRTRWHLPVLIDNAPLGDALCRELEAVPQVASAKVDPLTGNLLLLYDRECESEMAAAWVHEAMPIALMRPRNALATQTELPAPGTAPLLRLLHRMEHHRPLVRKMVVSGFFNHLFDSSPPLLIGTGLDIVTLGGSPILRALGFKSVSAQLFGLGGIGLALWATDAVLDYIHKRSAVELADLVRHELRNEMYEHLQRLDLAQIEARDISGWMNVIEDDLSKIHGFIRDGSDPIITILANSVAVGGAALTISPRFALAQVLLVPPVVVASQQLLGPLRARLVDANRDADRVSALVHGNVSGLATISSFGAQEAEALRVKQAGEQYLVSSGRAADLSAMYVPVLTMIVGSGFMSTLVYGGMMVQTGELLPSSYNIVAATQLRMLAAIGHFGASLQNYQRTTVALERVFKVLDMQPAIASREGAVPITGLRRDITFDQVSFGYEDDRLVLHDFQMTFPAGKTVGIVGSSGAGKSTVLKLLSRFYDVTAGAVRYDGVDVRDLKLDDLHHAVAMVSQELAVFAGTLRANIAYAKPEASDADVEQASRVAEAHDFISALPLGYDTVVGYGGLSLSAGQRQRVAIARAVLADRPILLFDEATSALDYQTEAAVQRSLQEATAGRTTIIVAHRLSTIRRADLIYVLDEGRVKEQGRHDELIAADGIYAAMWKVQTGEVAPAKKPRRT